MVERIIQIDSVDAYNKLYGWETLHPLVTVVNHANPMASDLNHSRLNYGLYALFLKQGDGCSIRYGREKYDYQEGTVVSFKPGQVVEVEWDESRPMPLTRTSYRFTASTIQRRTNTSPSMSCLTSPFTTIMLLSVSLQARFSR